MTRRAHPRSVVLAAQIMRRNGYGYAAIARALTRAGTRVGASTVRDWTKYRTRVVT